jgi:hypothetical protein
MIHALCEEWHTDTSSFHLPVGEMTITLDDVSNLLHLPTQGRMLYHDPVVDRAHGITRMTRLIGMLDAAARAESKSEYGAHISYTAMKRRYESHLTEARRLEHPQMRSFLLYLIGSALFTNKTNRRIDLVYIDYMVDLNVIGKWSWEG